MSEPEAEPLTEGDEGAEPSSRPPIQPWKRVLLGLAVLSVLVGLGLQAFGGESAPAGGSSPGVTPGGTGNELSGSFLPQSGGEAPTSGSQGSQEAEPEGLAAWSPMFVKGGFSFFVGFCIGYALRAFFKISAIVLGVIFLALLGLQQVGFVEIDWAALSDAWDVLVERLSGEFGGIREFLTGSLPSAALAGLGLFTGFQGKR